MNMKKTLLISATLIASLTLLSCVSNKEIPTSLTTAQLIQNAQNAYEKSDYKGAVKYYETLVKRYGTDLSIYVEAQYELGHIYLRNHKYEKAYEYFVELLDIYETSAYGNLPTAYKKLAQIGVSQIPEKKLAAIQAEYNAKKAPTISTEPTAEASEIKE